MYARLSSVPLSQTIRTFSVSKVFATASKACSFASISLVTCSWYSPLFRVYFHGAPPLLSSVAVSLTNSTVYPSLVKAFWIQLIAVVLPAHGPPVMTILVIFIFFSGRSWLNVVTSFLPVILFFCFHLISGIFYHKNGSRKSGTIDPDLFAFFAESAEKEGKKSGTCVV